MDDSVLKYRFIPGFTDSGRRGGSALAFRSFQYSSNNYLTEYSLPLVRVSPARERKAT